MQTTPIKQTQDLFEQFKVLEQPEEYSWQHCEEIQALIGSIQALKLQHDAVILAHNYQRPEIFEVADFIGDSLELARKGRAVPQRTIVFCGVHFMAETAKILAPEKRVIIPDQRAGCSLAEAVDAQELLSRRDALLGAYPDLKVVSYVNTTAEVKAVSDVCCTSSNALKIVERIDGENILFVPDENLAAYVARNTSKNIIAWNGNCYVHHQIQPEQILHIREVRPHLRVLAHPECRKDVLAVADAVLSTSGMIRYARENEAVEFLIVTECGLSDRLMLEVPDKHFYKACQLCMYMKMITLEGTRDALLYGRYEVDLEPELCEQARRSLVRMFELS